MLQEAKTIIERAWEDRALVSNSEVRGAIDTVIGLLDKGNVRIAEPSCAGEWLVNEWIKKAVILFFPVQQKNSNITVYDKIPLKKEYQDSASSNIVVKYGSYIDRGVTLMPCYINTGAHIESGSVLDAWVSVNSCAQIGKNVHLSENVVIGGVLEPPQAAPVIIEEGCFIGANSNLMAGIYIQKESIIAPNTTISRLTKILDITGPKVVELKGMVPERSIVTTGYCAQKLHDGEYHLPCALIIGKRNKSDDLKLSFSDAVEKYKLSV